MKKLARRTTRAPKEDADPLGLLSALHAKLKEAYYAQLRAFLGRNLLVRGIEPAARRRILDAGTIQGGPVSFPLMITVYPRDATGFARVVGKLETSLAEPSDEHLPDQQPDDPEGVYITSILTGKPVWMPRPKRGWRKFGRRR